MTGRIGAVLTRALAGIVTLASVATLIYVHVFPPPSMRLTREGVPHFTPPVINPATGEPLDVGELVRHYRGE